VKAGISGGVWVVWVVLGSETARPGWVSQSEVGAVPGVPEYRIVLKASGIVGRASGIVAKACEIVQAEPA
jgi:hypothetical protein